MRLFRYVLLLVLLLSVSTAHAAGGRACGGRTYSDSGACCISGTVTLYGKPVEGAVVTVWLAEKGAEKSDTTSVVDGDQVRTYGFVLHEEPLYARPGDTLTIHVAYGKWFRELSYVVQPDEQWLDIELSGSADTPTTW